MTKIAFGLLALGLTWPSVVISADFERNIVGFATPRTVRPGEVVEVKVTTVGEDAAYEADLVKVINGDSLSTYKDLFEMRPVEAEFTGSYYGIEQQLHLGSYIEIDPSPSLDSLESFTVGAWIFPTFNPAEYVAPDLENPDPFSPPTMNIAAQIAAQTIVSRFDGVSGTGWHLSLDETYHLGLTISDGDISVSATLDEPVRDWDWAYVVASYDAASGTASVRLFEEPFSPGDQFTARDLSASVKAPAPRHQGPLRVAAIRNGEGAAMALREKPGNGFNGRIQDVRIANVALSEEDARRMMLETAPIDLASQIVLNLDFSVGIKTDRATDVSGRGNHGVVVNIPERAVRGRFWTPGSSVHWAMKETNYDAIHFHADDLYDAEWKTDFTYTIPRDLPSGVYAARLKRGDFTDYAVFFVAPPKGEPSAKLAFWASTYNYLAYSNISIGGTVPLNYPSHNLNEDDYAFMRLNKGYAAGGVYNMHVDGTYFIYASPLRPDLHLRPDGLLIYSFPQDTHALSFLEHEAIAYDVITDELVDQEGAELLKQYDVVLSSSHPEYITGPIWDALSEYTMEGGRLIYPGGNGWFWAGAENPAYPGVYESRNFSAIGERSLTGGQVGGLLVETGRMPGPVVGLEMAAMTWHGAAAFTKLEDAANPRAAFIFEGTSEGDEFGWYGIDRVRPGVAGFETDKFVASNGTPRHALHLATNTEMNRTIENVKLGPLPLVISYDPATDNWAGADVVFFETANGGAVFSAGAITWMSSTPENGYDNDVAQITRNVINRFLDPTPFPPIPVAEVEDVDRPPSNPEYEHADQK